MNDGFQAHAAQVELAKQFSSVTLLGPPLNEKLVRLVAHLFSPEEAEVARRLPFYYPRPLTRIAKKAGRRPEDIAPLLDEMARRRVIYGGAKGYSLLPLIPGMFEYMLMGGADSEWHREYARLLNDLYSTGFVRRYGQTALPAVRNIPVQSVVENKSRIVDADLMSEMIAAHEHMAVLKVCQCRQSVHFSGGECKRSRPEDGCLIFGSFASSAVNLGDGRMVESAEMRDIVAERWEKKLVFLTGNVAPNSPNSVCTCCDCCCHFLETVNHFGGQNLLAPPHYRARVDASLCNNCGKCARACNTYAHTMENKKHLYAADKCLGCGACIGVCKEEAISLIENPAYKPPSKSFATLGLRLLPATAWSGLKAKLAR
ncbi:MAG TPA: 4Fe-4S dicluster domain-containing protein [bacterium]|nr:4Fe-4S dicluster domain-containing protein [bacterium]